MSFHLRDLPNDNAGAMTHAGEHDVFCFDLREFIGARGYPGPLAPPALGQTE